MKQSGDLDYKILKEIIKLSELEFLGVLKFLNISVVEETTSPVNLASSEEEPKSNSTLVENRLIDKNKLDNKSISPRAFQNLIEDLANKIQGLNRTQKRNLYHFIRKITKKRGFKGNQNFLVSEKEE